MPRSDWTAAALLAAFGAVAAGDETRDDRVVVGLVPSADAAVTRALADGARLALEEGRRSGGPWIELLVAAEEGRWAGAGPAAVALAFGADAVAVIAPPDRALAHPVSQVGTRTGVPVVATSTAASVTATGSATTWCVVPSSADDGSAASPPPFDASSPTRATRRFVAAFRARFGRTPGPWEAYGHDAGVVVADAVRRAAARGDATGRGTPSRARVAEALRARRVVGGATGPVGFDARGRRVDADELARSFLRSFPAQVAGLGW